MEICTGARGSFLLLSLPVTAERASGQGAELWRGRSCSSAFAVDLRGQMLTLRMYPEE